MLASAEYYDKLSKIRSLLEEKKIPDKYPPEVSEYFLSHYIDQNISRTAFISLSSFALISKAWLKPLTEYIGKRKCLEIMAGSGMLSKGLSDFGVGIIATDDFSWKWDRGEENEESTLEADNLWCHIENLDCEAAIEKYGAGVGYIICCWPPMDESMCKALLKMRKVNPECNLIYIGEGPSGCNADDSFFEYATYIKGEAAFRRAADNFQRWHGIHDRLCLIS